MTEEKPKEPILLHGFMSDKLYQNLLSPEFSIRLSASQSLLSFLPSVEVSTVSIVPFFEFSKPFLVDENFGVINCFAEIIEIIITKLATINDVMSYINEIIDILIPPLRDKRRAVRNLSSNLILHFSSVTKSYSMLGHLFTLFYTQPINSQLEILDLTGKIINVLDIPIDFFEKLNNLFENAFLIVNSSVHSAAVKLLKQIKEFDFSVFQKLSEDIQKLADSETSQIGSVRLPQTPTSALPPLANNQPMMNFNNNNNNRFPKPPETSNTKKRTDEFWYRSKPRFAKTAGFIINKTGNIVPAKPIQFNATARLTPEVLYNQAFTTSDDLPAHYEAVHIYDKSVKRENENQNQNQSKNQYENENQYENNNNENNNDENNNDENNNDENFEEFDKLMDPINEDEQIEEAAIRLPKQPMTARPRRRIEPPPPLQTNNNSANNEGSASGGPMSDQVRFKRMKNDDEFVRFEPVEPFEPFEPPPRVDKQRQQQQHHLDIDDQKQFNSNRNRFEDNRENSHISKQDQILFPEELSAESPTSSSLATSAATASSSTSSRPKRTFKPHPPPLLIPADTESPEELHIKKIKVSKTNKRAAGASATATEGKIEGKTTKTATAKRAKPDLSSLLNEMQISNEWEKQNEAVSVLTALVGDDPSFISTNLRILSFEIVPLCSSIRSALSKSALECLTLIASTFGSEMTSFFEAIVNDLLTILLSSRGFITRLASTCISTILQNVNRKKALEFLGGDHKRRPGCCKALIAMCLEDLCEECEDFTTLLKSISVLITDANPEARKHARGAVTKLAKKFPEMATTVSNSAVIGDAEKKAILSAV